MADPKRLHLEVSLEAAAGPARSLKARIASAIPSPIRQFLYTIDTTSTPTIGELIGVLDAHIKDTYFSGRDRHTFRIQRIQSAKGHDLYAGYLCTDLPRDPSDPSTASIKVIKAPLDDRLNSLPPTTNLLPAHYRRALPIPTAPLFHTETGLQTIAEEIHPEEPLRSRERDYGVGRSSSPLLDENDNGNTPAVDKDERSGSHDAEQENQEEEVLNSEIEEAYHRPANQSRPLFEIPPSPELQETSPSLESRSHVFKKPAFVTPIAPSDQRLPSATRSASRSNVSDASRNIQLRSSQQNDGRGSDQLRKEPTSDEEHQDPSDIHAHPLQLSSIPRPEGSPRHSATQSSKRIHSGSPEVAFSGSTQGQSVKRRRLDATPRQVPKTNGHVHARPRITTDEQLQQLASRQNLDSSISSEIRQVSPSLPEAVREAPNVHISVNEPSAEYGVNDGQGSEKTPVKVTKQNLEKARKHMQHVLESKNDPASNEQFYEEAHFERVGRGNRSLPLSSGKKRQTYSKKASLAQQHPQTDPFDDVSESSSVIETAKSPDNQQRKRSISKDSVQVVPTSSSKSPPVVANGRKSTQQRLIDHLAPATTPQNFRQPVTVAGSSKSVTVGSSQRTPSRASGKVKSIAKHAACAHCRKRKEACSGTQTGKYPCDRCIRGGHPCSLAGLSDSRSSPQSHVPSSATTGKGKARTSSAIPTPQLSSQAPSSILISNHQFNPVPTSTQPRSTSSSPNESAPAEEEVALLPGVAQSKPTQTPSAMVRSESHQARSAEKQPGTLSSQSESGGGMFHRALMEHRRQMPAITASSADQASLDLPSSLQDKSNQAKAPTMSNPRPTDPEESHIDSTPTQRRLSASRSGNVPERAVGPKSAKAQSTASSRGHSSNANLTDEPSPPLRAAPGKASEDRSDSVNSISRQKDREAPASSTELRSQSKLAEQSVRALSPPEDSEQDDEEESDSSDSDQDASSESGSESESESEVETETRPSADKAENDSEESESNSSDGDEDDGDKMDIDEPEPAARAQRVPIDGSSQQSFPFPSSQPELVEDAESLSSKDSQREHAAAEEPTADQEGDNEPQDDAASDEQQEAPQAETAVDHSSADVETDRPFAMQDNGFYGGTQRKLLPIDSDSDSSSSDDSSDDGDLEKFAKRTQSRIRSAADTKVFTDSDSRSKVTSSISRPNNTASKLSSPRNSHAAPSSGTAKSAMQSLFHSPPAPNTQTDSEKTDKGNEGWLARGTRSTYNLIFGPRYKRDWHDAPGE